MASGEREYDFSNIYGPPPMTPGTLEQGFRTPERRRRRLEVDEAEEEEAQAEAEQQRRQEVAAEAAASGSSRSERDVLVAMVQQMQQQSMLQNQMLFDMQQRMDRMERAHGPVQPPVAPAPSGDPFGCRGLDKSWIPGMPTPGWEKWKNRVEEIHGFWTWAEALISWLALLSPAYQGEIREVMRRSQPLMDSDLQSAEQVARGQRLFHLVKQSFSGCRKVEQVIKLYEQVSTSNGFELLRQIRVEYSLKSRSECLHFRTVLLETKASKHDSPVNILREIDTQLLAYRKLVDTLPEAHMKVDVDINESDLYLLIRRNLPSDLDTYISLHCGETVAEVRRAVEFFHSRSRLMTDISKVHIQTSKGDGPSKGDPKGKGKDKGKGKGKGGKDGSGKGKDKGKGSDRQKGKEKGQGSSRESSRGSEKDKDLVCYRCGKKGHQAKQCPQKNKDKDKICERCGKKGHVRANCRVKLPGQSSSVLEGTESQGSVEGSSGEPEDEARIFYGLPSSCL